MLVSEGNLVSEGRRRNVPAYDFELLLSRPFYEAELDTLFQRTRGQVTVAFVRDVHASVDRQGQAACVWDATTLAGAVMEIIDHIEASAPGLRAVRLEPDPLLSIQEIADRVGRSVESVRQAIKGGRAAGRFDRPEIRRAFPVAETSTPHRLWRWSAVADWYGIHDPQIREADPTAKAINGWLALREVVPEIAPDPRAVVAALSQVFEGRSRAAR
jgi:hypothetical protein